MVKEPLPQREKDWCGARTTSMFSCDIAYSDSPAALRASRFVW